MIKRIKRSFLEVTASLLIIGFIWFIVSYCFGLFNPVTVNKYVLTDGNKTVVFQEMRHIGFGAFYKKVNEDVDHYRSQNYILGYEGIFDIGNKEMYLGEKINYDNKYIEQPISIGGFQKTDVNLDLNWFEIMDKIEKKLSVQNKEHSEKDSYKKETIADIPLLKNQLEMASDGLDPLTYTAENIYRIRYFENLNNKYGIDVASIVHGSHAIEDSVIMDERNKIVADFIKESPNKNILIHYGAEHFKGILSLLKNSDSKWKIVSIEKTDVL